MSEVMQHYVTFYSPGTFVAETTTKPCESWDIEGAIATARMIQERYGATPYGFQFTTRRRGPDDLDSHESAKSQFYWLGGTIETLEQVKARATDQDRTLISNMEINGWHRIITNSNSWKWTQPLGETDVVIDYSVAP